MKELVSVLIPILNPVLSPAEKQVVDQCVRCLHKYSLIFVVSETAITDGLRENYSHADFVTFGDKYFQSRQTLGSLFLMEGFYERFSWSEFLLIHELNSWVVKDELHYWCKQGYDYLRGDLDGETGFFDSLIIMKGFDDNQKTNMDAGFFGNGLYLCHIERFLRTLKAKKKEAYAYRRQSGLIHQDILFWELEANRYWPYLRRPTKIVQKRFSQNLALLSSVSYTNREAWPFGLTGISEQNIHDLPYFS